MPAGTQLPSSMSNLRWHPVMRPPVACIVLPIPLVEVSRLEIEGTLTKVVNLLTGLEFFTEYLLKHLVVTVARVTAEIQGAATGTVVRFHGIWQSDL